MSEKRGLYEKYTVTNNETGEKVEHCFVLRPDKDLLAQHAIRVYAKAAGGKLGSDLNKWIDFLEDTHDTHI